MVLVWMCERKVVNSYHLCWGPFLLGGPPSGVSVGDCVYVRVCECVCVVLKSTGCCPQPDSTIIKQPGQQQ